MQPNILYCFHSDYKILIEWDTADFELQIVMWSFFFNIYKPFGRYEG